MGGVCKAGYTAKSDNWSVVEGRGVSWSVVEGREVKTTGFFFFCFF